MRKAARRIVGKLRQHGHEAFFAGGWVRDFLLRRAPKDIDIATSALPDEVLRIFPASTAIGAKFGVVQVRAYGRAYEVATFRSDNIYLDGRHPASVTFSGPEQDALRRDFTVNGLFFDPVSERLIDFVHGRADIQSRVIRTIGNAAQRFGEDKLRMMRAVRLACELGFEIEPESWDALRKHAPEILMVSWERIRGELIKLLISPAPDKGLDLLHESGLLAQVLPEVEAMLHIPYSPESRPEDEVFAHTQAAVAMLRKPSAVLAFGTLLHDVGKPHTYSDDERLRFSGHAILGGKIAGEICRRLRMSNEDADRVADLVATHTDFFHVKEIRESTLRRLLRKPNIADHLELHRADSLSSRRDLENYRFCLHKLDQYKHEPAMPPLIDGESLIEMGYQPGPIFKEIIQAVEDLQLEGALRTREEALEHIKQAFPLPGKT